MQQFIPADFIQDLLARVDIVDVVGRHVKLKKSGLAYKGLCPFHSEKTPSFTVTPSRGSFHCYGCGEHDTAIGFLMKFDGLTFTDAVKELASRYHMVVPKADMSPAQQQRQHRHRSLQLTLNATLEKASIFYQEQARLSTRAKDYFRRRQIDTPTLNRFGLGYAPDEWQPLAQALLDYNAEAPIQCGLVVARNAQGETLDAQDPSFEAATVRYDRLRDRITFPIRNLRGEVIGFGGRIIDQGEPKYLNSPETAVFHKGEELYGLFEARGPISRAGYALVVEGYMDVVALAQFGVEHAVATMGTACTPQQLQKLFRHTNQVVFSFDGDAAGRRAARRAMEQALPLLSDTRVVKFLFLPAEHDPDSYVREKGAEAFEREIARAQPLSEFLFSSLFDGVAMATAEGRAQALHTLAPLIQQIDAPALVGQLLTDFSRRLGMTPADLRALLTNTAPRKAVSATRRKTPPTERDRTPLSLVLSILLNQPDLWQRMSTAHQAMLSEECGPLRPLALAIESILEDKPELSPAALWEELRADGHHPEQILSHALDPIDGIDDDPARDLQILLLRIERDLLQVKLDALVASNDMSGYQAVEYASLFRRLQEIADDMASVGVEARLQTANASKTQKKRSGEPERLRKSNQTAITAI